MISDTMEVKLTAHAENVSFSLDNAAALGSDNLSCHGPYCQSHPDTQIVVRLRDVVRNGTYRS